MRERESFLKRLEERLSRMSGWLAARHGGGEHAEARARRARLEALRRELEQARHAIAVTTKVDLERARASVEDLERDYDVPPPHEALSREELEMFRRHLQTTARLLRERADLDDPDWVKANEEYERSWTELERAFEAQGGAASP